MVAFSFHDHTLLLHIKKATFPAAQFFTYFSILDNIMVLKKLQWVK